MKPSIATRSCRCSLSYHRLKSAPSAGAISIDVSNMPFPASGIFRFSSSLQSGGEIGDCAHHGVPHAGIVERVATSFDDADFGLRPSGRERTRRRGRTEQIVATLQDDAGNAGKLCRLGEKLIGSHEALVLKI